MKRFIIHRLMFIVILFALLIAMNHEPITVYAQSNSAFSTGFNVTGITSYSAGDVTKTLQEIKNLNGRVIRIFAANDRIGNDEAALRVDNLLTEAGKYQISAIVSFIDFYGTGFHPSLTSGFYTGNYNGIPLLNHDFFAGGYREPGGYLDFTQTVILKNKHHSNIFAWEIGNELKDDSDPQTFIDFMNNTTAFIKNLDPNHPISSGMINAAHTGLSPDQLYSQLPNLDIISVHTYDLDHGGVDDLLWAKKAGKQSIVGELGLTSTADSPKDRSGDLKSELNFWREQGASAVLYWGLIAQGLPDTGNGDRIFGMDNIWHGDYSDLAKVFNSSYTPIPGTPPKKSSSEETAIYTLNKGLLPEGAIKDKPEDQNIFQQLLKFIFRGIFFNTPINSNKIYAQSESIQQSSVPQDLKPKETSPGGQVRGFLGGSGGFYGVILPTEAQSKEVTDSELNFERANFPEGVHPITGQ